MYTSKRKKILQTFIETLVTTREEYSLQQGAKPNVLLLLVVVVFKHKWVVKEF